MEATRPQGNTNYLIYDGSCGACTVFIGERSRFFQRYGFTAIPLQEPWVAEVTGLTGKDLEKEILLLDKNNKLFRGADVYRIICKSIWWLTPIFLLSKMPVTSALFNFCYTCFAERRKSISRVCGLEHRAKY